MGRASFLRGLRAKVHVRAVLEYGRQRQRHWDQQRLGAGTSAAIGRCEGISHPCTFEVHFLMFPATLQSQVPAVLRQRPMGEACARF